MKLLIIFGAPGSGKGTASAFLSEQYGFIHISTGKIIRDTKPQELEAIIKKVNKEKNISMENIDTNLGNYMSDDVVNEMIRMKLNYYQEQNEDAKIILDGFPRTIVQAKYLEEHFWMPSVIYIDNVSDELIIQRLCNRYVCEKNEHIFNIKDLDITKDNFCMYDGSILYQRKDDSIEVIKKRLQIYKDNTLPLLNYYRDKKVVFSVRGDCSSKQLCRHVKKKLTII